MFNNHLFYITMLIAASIITLSLSIYVYRRKTAPQVRIFAYFLLATGIYLFAYSMAIYNTNPLNILIWLNVQYLAAINILVLWILSIITYLGKDNWLTRRNTTIFCIIPSITIILHFRDVFHDLYYNEVVFRTVGAFPLQVMEKTPWYWVQTCYTELVIMFGIVLLVNKWLKSEKTYRRQITIMLIGTLIPWTAQIIYIFGVSPWNQKYVPLCFTISCLIVMWGVFKNQLFDLLPVARSRVFESIRDGVLVFDSNNRLVDYNTAAKSILMFLSVEDIGEPASDLFKIYPELLKHVEAAINEQYENDLVLERDGVQLHYQCRISPIFDKLKNLMGKTLVITDITLQSEMMEQLRRMATIDSLTCAFNRKYFMEQSYLSINKASESGQAVSVILMDIDNFKQVNDRYGHQAGDITLKNITEICRNNLRPYDLFGRYGGEEFAILLPETSEAMAFRVAERIRTKIESSTTLVDGKIIKVTASFGIACVEQIKDINLDELLRQADKALYKAKDAGRNCVLTA